MEEPVLRVSALSGPRRGAVPLDDISFTAPAGAMIAVLGGPASGKSALLALLAGEAEPTAGQITLDGAPLDRRARAATPIGILRQRDTLDPRLSLAENVAEPLRRARLDAAARRALAEAALDLVELSGPDRRPEAATPAERQRAALARATIAAPRLLLLDDPLGAQDPESRRAALWILERVHRVTGAVTILTTRVAEEAMALADTLLVLQAGRLLQAGPPAAIYEQPLDARVAALTGPASLLPGHLIELDDSGEARVRLRAGLLVAGTARGPLRVRDSCTLCLRPERVAVAPVAASDMGEGALEATVIGVLRLGDQFRLRLLLGAGAEIEAARPAAAGLRGLSPGARVAIAWQPSHAPVF